jgi:non-ribosomal peptide synthetase component F
MFGSALPCRVAQLSSSGFDASVWEFLLALAHGGTLVVPRADMSGTARSWRRSCAGGRSGW